jgi:hypothetical protein
MDLGGETVAMRGEQRPRRLGPQALKVQLLQAGSIEGPRLALAGGDAEEHPGLSRRQSVGLDEERAGIDERRAPAGVGHQLADGPTRRGDRPRVGFGHIGE